MVEIVVRYCLDTKYRFVCSLCIYIVVECVSMSLSGLHSVVEMCACGIIIGGG